ncbi:hypothetical protein [Streptomyces griseus]|uniref:hypothetical protein n=1 Tax=Streptomyces griseus TaxID=1911 RepID=UPI001F47D6B8|nr:hypothetical protein [Streptomyces griseus]
MAGHCGRRWVRTAWVAATACALALGGAPGARAADRPDIAMIVPGGTDGTTALRADDPAFDRLWELLQPMSTGTEPVPTAWSEGRYPAVRLTVVWGLTGVGGWPQSHRAPGGDVAVERQDQLFLAQDGTPWVRTDPAPQVQDDDIRWHRAPRAAYDRLAQEGLLGESQDASGGGGRRSVDPLWWAAAGLAAGFAGGFLTRRAAARREAGPSREEPRQELIDL